MPEGRPALAIKLRKLARATPAPVTELLLLHARALVIAYHDFKNLPRESDTHADWLAFKLIVAHSAAHAAYEASFRAIEN